VTHIDFLYVLKVGFFHTFKLIWDSCSDEERSSRSVAGQTPADIIESTFQVRFDNFLEFLDFSSPGVFECLSREDTSMAGSSFQVQISSCFCYSDRQPEANMCVMLLLTSRHRVRTWSQSCRNCAPRASMNVNRMAMELSINTK